MNTETTAVASDQVLIGPGTAAKQSRVWAAYVAACGSSTSSCRAAATRSAAEQQQQHGQRPSSSSNSSGGAAAANNAAPCQVSLWWIQQQLEDLCCLEVTQQCSEVFQCVFGSWDRWCIVPLAVTLVGCGDASSHGVVCLDHVHLTQL
eukprot:GHUV01044249.1.p2 GENE.GHUV01044249.1~~GHUV01044249.1.p2  ORF type:complete len:148 (-),score=71.58 GHUV01044249.1:55-498(-)